MNKPASLLAVTLFLASSFASSLALAEADRSADLRYCLDLQSNYEIAKCSGELGSAAKGQPFSREEVEKIRSTQKTVAPAGTNEPSTTSATASDKPGKDSLPEKAEHNSN